MKRYDVVIIGAGPAGIFSALELSNSKKIKVALIDKGPTIEKRSCPQKNGNGCKPCKECSITSGWGGAGAFSDGKLTLSPKIGGWLNEFIEEKHILNLIKEVKETFIKYGAPRRIFGPDEEVEIELKRKARLADLELVTFPIMHLGTDNTDKVLNNFYKELENKVDIYLNTEATNIEVKNNSIVGVDTTKGYFKASDIIIAPGREGADWLLKLTRKLNIPVVNNAVDIGVRVEVPAEVMKPLTKHLYEAKLHYYSKKFEDRVRTFCMNPYGEVTTEVYEDVITVNGHSYANKKTENTNFAILVSKNFTEPFKEPVAYGKYIAQLANILSDGIIIQRLGDFYSGRRSTEERLSRSIVKPTLHDCVPGDLSLVFPYRHLSSIIEMIQAIDKLAPGVASRNTLLYGVEVKFYSARPQLTKDLETPIRGLYAIGDGAGITRSLVQSASSGIISARAILSKLN